MFDATLIVRDQQRRGSVYLEFTEVVIVLCTLLSGNLFRC